MWPREAELRSPTRPGEDGALIWGDGVFANALELEAWLRVRGVSYRDWARKHPAAVKLLAPAPPGAAPGAGTSAKQPAKQQPKPKAKQQPKPSAKQQPKPKATPAATTVPVESKRVAAPAVKPAQRDESSLVTNPVFIALLVVLGLLASALATGVARLRSSSETIDIQLGIAASALSIGIGILVASYLA